MPISRTPGREVPPVPHLSELDSWIDHWVALKDGKVIAASKTSKELACRLKQMGSRAEGAVTEFVWPGRDDGYIVGVG